MTDGMVIEYVRLVREWESPSAVLREGNHLKLNLFQLFPPTQADYLFSLSYFTYLGPIKLNFVLSNVEEGRNKNAPLGPITVKRAGVMKWWDLANFIELLRFVSCTWCFPVPDACWDFSLRYSALFHFRQVLTFANGLVLQRNIKDIGFCL